MKSIKSHSHNQRQEIINSLIPFLKEKFEDNFIGLAGDGSFARNEDYKYSDLELIVFLKELPKDLNWNYRKIIDGMLIVIIPETKESFIEKYLDISDSWYTSGAGKLSPIINEGLIHEINKYTPKDVERKCLDRIQKRWPHYQEINAKLFNLIDQEDKEAIPVAFYSMITSLLILLAYINQTPYITLGSYIKQARQFKILPKDFETLVNIVINGKYSDIQHLKSITTEIFNDLEEIVEKKGVTINKDNI